MIGLIAWFVSSIAPPNVWKDLVGTIAPISPKFGTHIALSILDIFSHWLSFARWAFVRFSCILRKLLLEGLLDLFQMWVA